MTIEGTKRWRLRCLALAAAVIVAASPARGDEATEVAPGAGRGERMAELAEELRRIANDHGPDAVILQTRLLMKTLGAGARNATEVRVVGPSTEDGVPHLRFDVMTGLVLDASLPARGQVALLWSELLGPALGGLGSLNLEPKNVAIHLMAELARERDPADGVAAELADARPGKVLSIDFLVPAPALRAVVDGSAGADGLAAAVRVRYQGRPLVDWQAARPQPGD